MKAMLLAAGLGTRLKPFTDSKPKALAPVNGQSLLERNIRYLQRFGINDVVVNVHHFARQIIDTLKENDGFGSRYQISDEADAVLETGGGLLHAAPFLQSEACFLLMNVDMLSNIDLGKLIAYHQEHGLLATLAVQQRDSSRQFLFDGKGRLAGWHNSVTGEYKPATVSRHLAAMAFSGIQVVSGKIFEYIKFTGKFSLVDLYLDLCPTHGILAYDHTGDVLLDVGKPESLALAARLFANHEE
ncbi:MAG: NTP transferase domain-containing protein [Edaphocola sp.]